jgi:hypothetical protein
MRKVAGILCVALSVALAGSALAREKKEKRERVKPTKVTGTFVSAELAGESVNWKLTLDEGGDKTFEMAANVVVMYSEKDGTNRARMLRAAGKKAPQAKGNTKVAQGTFVTAVAEGNKVVVTLSVDGAEQAFELSQKLGVMARDDKALVIASAGRGGKKDRAAGEGKKKGGGKRKKKGGDEEAAPDNL